MHAFIIRPFGTKNGIDFDHVETELIAPALQRLGFSGGTTAELFEQGNIRSDMFEQLLIADLVVADISIHNANVFYELGIRHACRERTTFMIRSSADEVPFDIKTDRYLCYDAENPAASLDGLVRGLRASWNSNKQDSPVFQLLPGLEQTGAEKYLVVPADFREEIRRAEAAEHAGHLQLLSAELDGFAWRSVGLQLIGDAQVRLCDWEGARASLVKVRDYHKGDLEATMLLGTVDHRRGDLVRSDQALERALAHGRITRSQRAEVYALMGRNAKSRWDDDWMQKTVVSEQQLAALESPQLTRSFELYHKGFVQDRNHFYSGINALGMVTVITELAKAQPDGWLDGFENDDDAQRELDHYRELREDLRVGVKLALMSRREALRRAQRIDSWSEISQADLLLMTSAKPSRVKRAYSRALADASSFQISAIRDQLLLYRPLGVMADNVSAALDSLPECEQAPRRKVPRVILFTGHRIDSPDRPQPRFPADKADKARALIQDAVLGVKQDSDTELYGISGGASGADILFQEVCHDLGIPTRVHLTLPKAQYLDASVVGAGGDWIERFQSMCARCDVRILSESEKLPHWLRKKTGYDVWQRSNLWMLYSALSESRGNMITMAFWDGKKGDGPGGTEDMIERTEARGARFIHIDATRLLEN